MATAAQYGGVTVMDVVTVVLAAFASVPRWTLLIACRSFCRRLTLQFAVWWCIRSKLLPSWRCGSAITCGSGA